MAFSYYDRIKETSATTGTGDLTLGGAVSQFQTFSSRFSNGDNMYYLIADQTGTSWETGVGTFNTGANSLSRTAVLESSNANAAVNFTSGALYVANVYAASAYVSSNVASPGTGLSTGTTANVTNISLPAGDWEVSGTVGFTANALTTATVFQGAISTTSATLPTAPGAGAMEVLGLSVSAGGVDPIMAVGITRLTLTAATTTVYLVAQSTFATNTMSAYGFIQAWRR